MGKKRSPKQNNLRTYVNSNFVRINEEANGQLLFEIGNHITTDLAEAVSILMRIKNVDEQIWNKELKIDFETIEPRRSLYWLSGGDSEWITLQNYNRPWNQCDVDFQEEFGFMIISILKKSKTLKDVRDGFIRKLSLPILYEFALSQKFIR